MLVHIQIPGARVVAPASRWRHQWDRLAEPDARLLVILQSMGPVMFVFDVSDMEPDEGAPPLLAEVERPFDVRGAAIGGGLGRTIENAKGDGVRLLLRKGGSQWAGQIGRQAGFVEVRD